jgi:hypothetical protein
VGRARVLRNRIIEPHKLFDEVAEKLIAPLRPRARFTPVPRHKVLQHIVTCWREYLNFGRLNLIAEFTGGKLDIVDLRVAPDEVTGAEWQGGDPEPALSVLLYALNIAPAVFKETEAVLAVVGLHALARRYERGTDRSDTAVLADLIPLARQAPELMKRDGKFEVVLPDGSGRWLGLVTDGKPFVRTFIGES